MSDFVNAPDVQGFLALDARALIGATIDRMEGAPVLAPIREDYILSYQGDRFARSIDYVRQYPTDLELLRDKLGTIAVPVQVIAGRRDSLVPLSNEKYLVGRLRSSELHVLDAAHFA